MRALPTGGSLAFEQVGTAAFHVQPDQAVRDRELRDALEDRGYRVHAIRFDEPFEEQLARHPETFGAR